MQREIPLFKFQIERRARKVFIAFEHTHARRFAKEHPFQRIHKNLRGQFDTADFIQQHQFTASFP